MIYTIENIPAKLYFKISSTNDYQLLSTIETKVNLEDKWFALTEKDELNQGQKGTNKILKLSSKVQSLTMKHTGIINAVESLKIQRDNELENFLTSNRYPLKEESFYEDLEKIYSSIKGLEFRIKRFQSELDKHLSVQSNQKESVFEDLFMSYLAFLSFGFKDANTITLLEFRGLEKQVFSKVKSLENHGKK